MTPEESKQRDDQALLQFLEHPVPTPEGNMLWMSLCAQYIQDHGGKALVDLMDTFTPKMYRSRVVQHKND